MDIIGLLFYPCISPLYLVGGILKFILELSSKAQFHPSITKTVFLVLAASIPFNSVVVRRGVPRWLTSAVLPDYEAMSRGFFPQGRKVVLRCEAASVATHTGLPSVLDEKST